MKTRMRRIIFSFFVSAIALAPLQTMPANAASPNLISNSSVESNTNNQPNNWSTDKWGNNNATFAYKTGGAHAGSRSLYTSISSYTNGDAKWQFTPVSVTGNTSYTYSDYYKSSTRTELVARLTDAQGNDTYRWLAGATKSSSWKKVSTTFTTPANTASVSILHILSGRGWLQTDSFNLIGGALAPTVSITSPAGGAVLSGTTTLSASANDTNGVSGVQFKVDGIAIGAEVTTAPYQTQWDTKNISDGQHSLTAVARNNANLTTTSSSVTVIIQNTTQTDPNLVPNPSVEIASNANPPLPQGWATNKSKINTTSFAYQNTGHSGNRSLNITMSAYTNGDAYWSYPAQPVTGGKLYEFSDWYQSDVNTYIYAEVTMQDGSQQWLNIGTAWHTQGWNHFDQQFTVPAGAVSIMVYHSMAGVGYLNTDDYKLVEYNPTGFTRGMVSLTFDDSLRSTYLNGLPLLQKYNMLSTQYMLSGYTSDPNYMTPQMMKAFADTGHEVGAHTITHSSLIDLDGTQLLQELRQSQTDLLTITGQKPTDFATPHGEYNAESLAAIKQYYRSHRSVDTGFNSKDNFDIYNIKVQNVLATTTMDQVAAWVAQAYAQHTWLVLVYHGVGDPVLADSAAWSVTADQLDSQLAAIKASGISVQTVSQALDQILPQL